MIEEILIEFFETVKVFQFDVSKEIFYSIN